MAVAAHRPHYHLTPAERAEMAALYVEGRLTLAEIDRRFRVSHGVCREFARTRGLIRRGRSGPPQEIPACRVDGCARPGTWRAGSMGYCSAHRRRVYRHGEPGPAAIAAPTMPEHGTMARRRRGCHCPPCTAEGRAHASELRALRRERGLPPGDPRHGVYGYSGYGCRCRICTKAHATDNRDSYRRRHGRAA